MPSDVELLAIEIDGLWLKDKRGRLLQSRHPQGWAAPHLVIGAAQDGWTLAFSSDVPDSLANELQAAFDAEPPPADPAEQPKLAKRCQSLLGDALGSVELQSGPSYIVPPGTTFETEAEIVRSDHDATDSLRNQDFERINWPEEDWHQLIDGELGPWAFVMDGNRVVSMCHSARLVEQGAEAGTWTDPDYRGRGYAAAATAAWAELLVSSGRTLFYSTSADNTSSQSVARRLGLPLIGWMWRVAAASS
jgi:GNAT superfamily N-acetyltransferase